MNRRAGAEQRMLDTLATVWSRIFHGVHGSRHAGSSRSRSLRPREDHAELRIEAFASKISPQADVLWHRDGGSSVAIAWAFSNRRVAVEVELVISNT